MELHAGHATIRSERLHRESGAALRRLVWDPVRNAVSGQSEIFIVPSGPLHLVNWGALPDHRAGYLIEGAQLMHYLSSERDLSRPVVTPGNGLVLVDNPAYGPTAARPVDARAAPGAPRVTGTCRGLESLTFDALPESRREGDAIAGIWQSDVVRLTGRGATEAAIRARVRGSRVVHFATHGFFLGAWCAPATAVASTRHPLLLAGLALAGANTRESRNNADDGVLLAEEIATLDMRGVDWAVLSACDTGAGVIAAGEELFGLRRAFQIAGVNTVIVSLWPVDDDTTRGWMEAVYKARFRSNATTAAAIRAATVKIIAARRARGQTTHPAYWGAFVAAGGA